MYEKRFTRLTPGCIIFLLDRSDSMNRHWAVGGTLSTGAAAALNRTIANLATLSTTGTGRVRHYFDVGVFGYGMMASTGNEGVESALGGALAGQALVPLPELAENPLREDEVPSPDAGAPPVRTPVWVDPVAGYRTPMCEAIALAGSYINGWVQAHPDSFPPIVINITDGQVTDRYADAPLAEWADRLRMLETEDGAALLFNAFLAPSGETPISFPSSANGLPIPGPELFAISSVLPATFVQTAASQGLTVPEGGRAFCFNADFATLQKFLIIGTTPASLHAG